MLEMTFQTLISRINAAASSHLRDESEDAMRSTEWDFVFGAFDGWVVLHVSTHGGSGYWMHPMLVLFERRARCI